MVNKKSLMKGKRLEYLFAAFLIFFLLSMNTLPYSTFVTVDKNAPWVFFYNDRTKESSDVVRDFRNQGWQIQTKVACGGRSDAQDSWNEFNGEYKNNPALLLLGKKQTPEYDGIPYYFAGLIYTNTQEAGKSDCVDFIYGNNGNAYNDGYALVRFGMDGARPVISIWQDVDMLYLENHACIYAYRWVAVFGNDHDKDWYIFNSDGLIIDSQIIPTNQPDDPDEPADDINGNNPETNPLLNDPATNSDDSNDELPPVNPDDLVTDADSGEYNDEVVSSLLITEIAVIGFLIVGLLLLFKHKKKLKK